MTKESGENKGAAKVLDARDLSGGILEKRNAVSYVRAKSVRWDLVHLLPLLHSFSLINTVRNIASRLSWSFTANFFFMPCMPLLQLPLIFLLKLTAICYSRFSRDVTAAMLAYRTVEKKSFGNLIYYYAKLEVHFAIVLYTNVAVSSTKKTKNRLFVQCVNTASLCACSFDLPSALLTYIDVR